MVKISLAAALLLAVSDAVSLTKLTCDAVTLTKVTDADTLEDLTKAVENVADIDQAFSDDDASDADADSDHASADDSEHDDDDDTASEQLTLTEQFEQTLADIKGPDIKGRPLFIGDSDIEGWRTNQFGEGIGTEPGKSASGFLLPGSNNVGVGGATCAEVKGWVSDALTKLEPSFVVIVCGENDINTDNDTEEEDRADTNQAFADFKTAYELIAETGVRAYTVSTKPEPGTKELHSEYEAYDALVLGLARELSLIPPYDTPLVIIDSYNGFKALGNPDSLYNSDELYDGDTGEFLGPEAIDANGIYHMGLLHMGPSGYERWAAWLGTAVNNPNTGCLKWLSCECAEYSAQEAIFEPAGISVAIAEGDDSASCTESDDDY